MSERGPRRAKGPSGFRVEMRRSMDLLDRWISHELNRYFDLSVHGASYRGIRTLVLLLAVCVLAFLIHMLLVVNPLAAAPAPQQLPALIAAGVITALRIGLVLGIAILFGMRVAGDYLVDVFEIKDVNVAREFISRLISGAGGEVLHLRDGRIAEEDSNSPVVLIGGPGYVITENDTAALFEKPDGTPHVVGPTSGGGASAATLLGGFERMREPIVNLRDQYIGSLGGEPMTVVSRSLDGMPISAVDVRGVYSIRRKPNDDLSRPASETPYPFDPEAIEDLIYRQAVPVLTDGSFPSGQPGGWNSAMQALIRESLADFMSHNKLGEYVAGVGEKEVELSEFREDTILSQTLRLSTEATEVSATSESPKPKFHPRTELTARFLGNGEEFTRRAREYGLELHWIGVGTWQMPDDSSSEAVKEKHLEAWRIHRETTRRADPKPLEAASETALVDETLQLIREVPITSHQKNQSRYSDKDVLVECLLQDYWGQMGDALNVCYDSGPLSPEQANLEQAVTRLEELLRIRQLGYLVGGGTMSRVRPRSKPAKDQAPPAPSSRGEADRYRALLGKLGGDFRVAEGMIANENKRHPDLSREELMQRILLRFERYGR
jgi:hypothetical protein